MTNHFIPSYINLTFFDYLYLYAISVSTPRYQLISNYLPTCLYRKTKVVNR